MQCLGYPYLARAGIAAVISLSACNVSMSASGEGPPWGYQGESGPDRWGLLSGEYRLCGEGTQQSPIDIAGADDASPDSIKATYRRSTLTLVNKRTTVNVLADGHLSISGERFDLQQLHFHAPSEHTFGGAVYGMEVHFVHRSSDGRFAVIGAFMQPGEENPALKDILANVPARAGEMLKVPDVAIDPTELLPPSGDGYTYAGSLTTPPCTEGISWYMLAQPVEVSEAQIAEFQARFGMNARPIQPLGGRTVQSMRFVKTSDGK